MTENKLRILQVSNRVPYPLNEGGTIGIYNYTRGFSEAGCEVTLLAQSAKKHKINEQEAYDALAKYATYHSYPIDTDVKIGPALKNLFTNKSYNVERFYDAAYEKALIDNLKENSYDVIQIEGTFPALYSEVIFKHRKNALVVLRQHNVEFQIWQRLASNTKNPIKRWYLQLLADRLKAFEEKHLNQYDALVPVTADDGELFQSMGCSIPVFPSPAGIDTELWKPSTQEDSQAIYHIGSLEWLPNLEAIDWFVKDVWPLVQKDCPDANFYVAGKGMPEEYKAMQIPGVEMIGQVESATEFVNDKAITVVPLKSGSGIRLKILEAMSAGKVVISTTIGAQGITCTDGKDILIADTPEEFCDAIRRVTTDENLANNLKQNARRLIEEQYSNQSVIRKLLDFYQSLRK